MVLPLFIMVLTTFAAILIPYQALTAFWRYWLYYLDPFTYLMQGLTSFPIWNADVECKPHEYGLFDPPAGMTCGECLEGFMKYATGYLNSPRPPLCQYWGGTRRDMVPPLNGDPQQNGRLERYLDHLTVVVSSYALVFLLLKLRSEKTKTASWAISCLASLSHL